MGCKMPLVFNFRKTKPQVKFKQLLDGLQRVNIQVQSAVTYPLGYIANFTDDKFNKLCQLIESKSVDPNTENNAEDTLLSITAAFGNNARLQKLLSIAKFTPETLGMALIYAAKYDNYSCVQTLLDHGADVNWTFLTHDALQTAATFGAEHCIGILLERGANPNRITKSGYTALMLAIDARHLDCAQILVRTNAEFNESTLDRINGMLLPQDRNNFTALLASKSDIPSLPDIKAYMQDHKDNSDIRNAVRVFYESAENAILNDGSIKCLLTHDELVKDDDVEMLLIKLAGDNYVIRACAPGTLLALSQHKTQVDIIPGVMIAGSQTVASQSGKLGTLMAECKSLCAVPEQEQRRSRGLD